MLRSPNLRPTSAHRAEHRSVVCSIGDLGLGGRRRSRGSRSRSGRGRSGTSRSSGRSRCTAGRSDRGRGTSRSASGGTVSRSTASRLAALVVLVLEAVEQTLTTTAATAFSRGGSRTTTIATAVASATMATMAGHRDVVLTTQQSNTDHREEDRDAKNQCTIHPNSSKTEQVPYRTGTHFPSFASLPETVTAQSRTYTYCGVPIA